MTTLICKQKGPRLWPGLNVLFNSCSYSPIQAQKNPSFTFGNNLHSNGSSFSKFKIQRHPLN